MTKVTDVFERYEKKYLLSASQYSALRARLTEFMTEDQYGLYPICNLYFDTENYALIRASLEKPVYKEKLRLRSYGVPKAESKVYLELKKKYRGVVFKRRFAMTQEEARRYVARQIAPSHPTQIFREIDWAWSFYQPSPKAFIAYDRLALFANEDPELRVTFDRNLRFRESLLDLAKGDWGTPLLEPGTVLMEIKTLGAMPVWLSRLLSELSVFPSSFSKYGACYQNYLIKNAGGMTCAG